MSAALGVVLTGQSVDECRYCGHPAVSIRLRFYARIEKGLVVAEAWDEMHECPERLRTAISDLVDSEVFGDGGVA